MEKIGFVGAFDKTDLIIYIAKILVELNQKVLVIDSTITQKARYVVPTILPSQNYITSFEGIDVAVGFKNFKEIESYQESIANYDIILIDIDSATSFHNFNMLNAEQNFFVTAFDSYSLKKGLKITDDIGTKAKMTKVLFSENMSNEDNLYLNFLSFNYSISWEKAIIYFPYDFDDMIAIIDNQKSAIIKFKNLSVSYKNGLRYIVEKIKYDVKAGDIKKILKTI